MGGTHLDERATDLPKKPVIPLSEIYLRHGTVIISNKHPPCN